MADRDELDLAGGQEPVELVELQHALVVDADDLEVRADLLAEHVPGHEVRVVLHLRDDDRVAGADVRAPPRVRDEVDGLGRVLREDRRARRPVQPRRDAVARALEQLGRLRRQRVDAAMNGPAMVLVVVVHRVEHRPRRLRCRGGIEVDDALAVQRGESGLRVAWASLLFGRVSSLRGHGASVAGGVSNGCRWRSVGADRHLAPVVADEAQPAIGWARRPDRAPLPRDRSTLTNEPGAVLGAPPSATESRIAASA